LEKEKLTSIDIFNMIKENLMKEDIMIEKNYKRSFIEKDKSLIPLGLYCYTYIGLGKYKPCPYWDLRKDKPIQGNGYCAFLNIGDWMEEGSGLLWDSVKECKINYDDEE
jgi:hypothetical protein